MLPTEEQLTALGNYLDITTQHASEIAEAIGAPQDTFRGRMEGVGEPTSEQADKILEFLSKSARKLGQRRSVSRAHRGYTLHDCLGGILMPSLRNAPTVFIANSECGIKASQEAATGRDRNKSLIFAQFKSLPTK